MIKPFTNRPTEFETDQKNVLLRTISDIVHRLRICSLLDIGAGDTKLASALSKIVDRYVAIERDQVRCERLSTAGLSCIQGEFPTVKINGSFDMVLSSHSIPESIELYQPFLSSAWASVAQGGWLCIITFKGVTIDRRIHDAVLFQELKKILLLFGQISEEKMYSHIRSEESGRETFEHLVLLVQKI